MNTRIKVTQEIKTNVLNKTLNDINELICKSWGAETEAMRQAYALYAMEQMRIVEDNYEIEFVWNENKMRYEFFEENA